MFGEIFASYVEQSLCYASYCQSNPQCNPQFKLGSTVRIIRAPSHNPTFKIYEGCDAIVLESSNDFPFYYKLREITTRQDIHWFEEHNLVST